MLIKYLNKYKKMITSLNKTILLCEELSNCLETLDDGILDINDRNLFYLDIIISNLINIKEKTKSIIVNPELIKGLENGKIIDLKDFSLSKQLLKDDTIYVDLNQKINIFEKDDD